MIYIKVLKTFDIFPLLDIILIAAEVTLFTGDTSCRAHSEAMKFCTWSGKFRMELMIRLQLSQNLNRQFTAEKKNCLLSI